MFWKSHFKKLSEEEEKQFEKLRDDSKKKLAELQKHQTENAGIKIIDEPTRRESAPHVRRGRNTGDCTLDRFNEVLEY